MTTRTVLLALAAIGRYVSAAPIDETAEFQDIFARSASAAPIIETTDRPLLALRPVQAPPSLEPPVSQQVVPQSSVSLHYAGVSSGSSNQSSSALVNIPKVTYPIVNAVGASSISNVVCSGGQAHVTFTDKSAFAKAAASWTKSGLFTLVTFSDSCGTGLDDATHDFILVHNVASQSADRLSISVAYTDIQLQDAVDPDALISVQVGNAPRPAQRWSIGGWTVPSLPPISIPPISIPPILIPPISIPNPLDSTLKGSYTKNVNFRSYPSNAQSPWGSAYRIYNSDKVTAYCVGCGADGSFYLSAAAEFNLRGDFKTGYVSVKGNLNGAAVFGLVGQVGVTVPLPEITLAQLSIEGLSVPGIFSVGPVATIGAGGSITVKAKGQLEAGAKLTWPNIEATLDIAKSSTSGVTGWQPIVDPVFNAAGTVSSTLDLHLTNTLAFGVSIPAIKFNKQVALIDKPGVQVTAGIQGTASLDNGKVTGTLTGPCKGVSISANFYNLLTANIFNIKTFTLSDWTSPSLTKCIVIPELAQAVAPPVVVSSTKKISSSSTTTTSSSTRSSKSLRTTSTSSIQTNTPAYTSTPLSTSKTTSSSTSSSKSTITSTSSRGFTTTSSSAQKLAPLVTVKSMVSVTSSSVSSSRRSTALPASTGQL